MSRSSTSASVLLIESNHTHELLTTAIVDPPRIRHIPNFAQTTLSPYFTSRERASASPRSCNALMLDRTLCLRRQIVWLVIAVGASLVAGFQAGGVYTDDRNVDLALAVGGVIFSVLSTIQMVLTRVYQSREI